MTSPPEQSDRKVVEPEDLVVWSHLLLVAFVALAIFWLEASGLDPDRLRVGTSGIANSGSEAALGEITARTIGAMLVASVAAFAIIPNYRVTPAEIAVQTDTKPVTWRRCLRVGVEVASRAESVATTP